MAEETGKLARLSGRLIRLVEAEGKYGESISAVLERLLASKLKKLEEDKKKE